MVYQLTDFQYIIYSSFASSGVKEVKVRAEGPKAPEAARPERAEAPSPGHRPGYDGNQQDAL